MPGRTTTLPLLLLLLGGTLNRQVFAEKNGNKSASSIKGQSFLSPDVSDESSDDWVEAERFLRKKCSKGKATCAPSSAPSDSPSSTPTLSNAPSLSPAPSLAPSVSPTKAPTVRPSVSPTDFPSIPPSESPSTTPTLSLAPSISSQPTPYAFIEWEFQNTDEVFWKDFACLNQPPDETTDPYFQETIFQYFLYTDTESIPIVEEVVNSIEQEFVFDLAKYTLDCEFDDRFPFMANHVSSLPKDILTGEPCPDDKQISGLSCFTVEAGFTVSLFYNLRRLQTQEQSEMIDAFGEYLNSLFGGDQFVGGVVQRTEFIGFVLRDNQPGVGDPTGGGGETDGDGDPNAIQGGQSSRVVSNDGLIVGGITVAFSLLALLIMVILLINRRTKGDFDSMNSEDSDVMVLKEAALTSDSFEAWEGNEDEELKAYVVNDTETVDESIMQFERQTRTIPVQEKQAREFPSPTFVATDVQRETVLPKTYSAAGRSYNSSDTVDL